MSYDMRTEALESEVQVSAKRVEVVFQEVSKRIVGQTHVAKRLLMAMVAQGHVLLEGMPGLAKTTIIKSLSETASLDFKRIQFTPDLLPADVIGTQIYDPRSSEFQVKKGPIFSNLILADEINRAPAKVQSALLEAMEERQITIGDTTFPLDEPFLVMATQNPVEQEGTYPLPEAQVDRFLFKLLLTYTSAEDEQEMVRRASLGSHKEHLQKVISKQEIKDMRLLTDRIYISDKIRKYLVDIVYATRKPKEYRMSDLASLVEYGASPRASLAIDKLARVNAMFEGRSFVTPQDVKDVVLDILRHRIKLTYEAEAENIKTDEVVRRILERVDVP